jgi:hypothetical protein
MNAKQTKTAERRKRTRKAFVTPPECYTVQEFCEAHRMGRATYYQLKDQGLAPVEIRLGGKILITKESATRWRAVRDAEAEAEQRKAAS